MSQPQESDSNIPLDISGLMPVKTMFASEGNPNTVLVTRSGRNYSQEVFWFPHPITAFQWCLNNGAGFVFTKAVQNVSGN